MIKMMMGIQGGPSGKQFATWKINLFHYNRYCKSANYVAIFHCQLGLPKGWPKRVDMIYPPIIKHGNRKSLINRVLFIEKSSRRVGNWTRRRCPFDVCGPIVVWRFAMDFMFFCQVCVSIPLVSLFFCALAIKYGHFIPGKVLNFWWAISQSDSGAMVLAHESVFFLRQGLVTSVPRFCHSETSET